MEGATEAVVEDVVAGAGSCGKVAVVVVLAVVVAVVVVAAAAVVVAMVM